MKTFEVIASAHALITERWKVKAATPVRAEDLVLGSPSFGEEDLEFIEQTAAEDEHDREVMSTAPWPEDALELSSAEPHFVRDDFIQIDDGDKLELAWIEPATQPGLPKVVPAPDQEWSEPIWVRLRDGTLIYGVFPQADTYEEYSQGMGVGTFGEKKA